jgi:protein-tyrosine phosphatase
VAKKKARVVWADAPAEHDYPAAAAYLGLLAGPDLVQVLTALLSQAPTVHHRANDLLRAARLPLLDGGNPEVSKDLKRIDAREALSPVLLIRGDLAVGHPL